MNEFVLTVKRLAGVCPLTGSYLPEDSEVLRIIAQDLSQAYRLTSVLQTLQFRGQSREVYHNGSQLFFDDYRR